MTVAETITFIRRRADSYGRAFPEGVQHAVTVCPLSALGRGCGAWVPPYNIPAILRSIADEIEACQP